MTSFPSGETTPRRLLAYGCCSKRPSNKHIRAAGPCLGGQWAQREGMKSPVCSSHSNGHCTGPGGKNNRMWFSSHPKQVSSTKPSLLSCPSPVPPLYLDDDGLPFPTDVIQHRLRQIEAGYRQEVEQLRRQVRELQMRLDIRHCCAPPAEPPMDYEDDFTCLKESDGSDTEDFGSDHSEDCLSEASWEPVDKKETEVTRWVPDHMASHCFNCDCEFWLAKRRHHCRNCGNVFCAGCCHLKLPIPDQQLYDPVLVCNSCYEHIQVSRARELMSQHLKKPIATASSWMPEEMICPFLADLKGGSASGVVWKVPWYGSWTQSSKIPSWEILLGTMWPEQRNLNLAGAFSTGETLTLGWWSWPRPRVWKLHTELVTPASISWRSQDDS